MVEIPELRIVSDDLWARVKARQQAVRIAIGRDADGNALNRAHRRQFLLSGLLVCGACGAGFTIIARDRYGCATRKAKGTCGNSRTIKRQALEARVLAGLKEKLLAPELVSVFIAEFQAEVNRAAQDAQQRVDGRRRELEGIERKIAGILRAIEDGAYNPTLTRRLSELEQQKAAIEAALSEIAVPPTLRIHPNLAEVYREKVTRLEGALNAESTRTGAGEVIRGLIDRIVLTPKAEGLDAELHGDLAQILTIGDRAAGISPAIHIRDGDPRVVPWASSSPTGSQLPAITI